MADAVEDVGLLLVVLRERAHAVVGQELGLVEHAPQQHLHAVAAQQRQQAALAEPGSCQRDTRLGEVGPVGQEPVEAPLELRQLIEQVGLERLDREQRDQARPSSAP